MTLMPHCKLTGWAPEMAAPQSSFEEVQARLEQIVDEVNAEGITLDEALALYEEAVKLGLSACDLSEQDALAVYEAEQEAVANREADERKSAGEHEAVADSASGASAHAASDDADAAEGAKDAGDAWDAEGAASAENAGEAASLR